MTDRAELLEAALDSRPDGIVLLGSTGEAVFWNRAAEAITGYAGMEILNRPIPAALEALLFNSALLGELPLGTALPVNEGALVQVRHKLGHTLQTLARRVMLRNGLGEPIGMAVVFHPAGALDALPQGDYLESRPAEENRADFNERLQTEFEDFARGGAPFGLLWVGVDQGAELRRTHGVAACQVMLDRMRHALAQGLRPTEEMCRWGENEFLVAAHERHGQMLRAHAQMLVGLARTADFRWWGDRVSLTVSIGAAQAEYVSGETLPGLLERAHHAMETSGRAGGNRVTLAACFPPAGAAMEDASCLPS